jgi:saccharopine dehydrogenase-like NADP-dependent oxidoreductase
MKDILLVGAGKIGSMIADFLARSGDYRVTVADHSAQALKRLETGTPVQTMVLDVKDKAAMAAAVRGKFAVLSAAPYQITPLIADAAKAEGAHYLDLTEDVKSTRHVKGLAKDAETAFIPQCGLAPGFITIVAADLLKDFDELHDVKMRVGALPKFPHNALNYNMTWSTDGVINEYIEPCEAIVDGVRRETPAMEELESLSIDGVEYEAFNTSGGLGTLPETLDGKVRNLNYRTMRYPGHAAIMKVLLNDLGLRHRRDVLKDIMDTSLPTTEQDVVIIFVTVTGMKDGRLMQKTYANKVYSEEIGGVVRSAIQITTAAGICAVLDMLADGSLPAKGFIRQEDIPLPAFLKNRFGRYYAMPEDQQPEAAQTRAAACA